MTTEKCINSIVADGGFILSRHPAIAIIIAALIALIASCTGSTATAVEKIIIEPESITFAPGETKTVEFTITPDKLMFLDKDLEPVVEPGEFVVMVGSSSADGNLLKASFFVR